MDIIAGKKLLRAPPDGSALPSEEALKDKEWVLFYFSAHWCPPCQVFTSLLKSFYQNASDQGVEVVFVSMDRSEEAKEKYMSQMHGPWLSVDFESDEASGLRDKFYVTGIPYVVVVRKWDNLVVSTSGRRDIEDYRLDAIKLWRSKCTAQGP